jgi:hypothetical protein
MMIDKRDELIEKQKQIIETLEKIIAVQDGKEKLMQVIIDNLKQRISLIHRYNNII